MKSFLLGGVAAAVLATVAPAIAQVSDAGAAKVQTRADVAAKVQRHFARLDMDRDGVITQAEVQAGHALRGQRLAKRADRAQRAQKRDPAQRFARLDADSDGQITRAEVDAQLAARSQRQAAAGKAVAARPQAGERLFARLDTNRDGAISRAEFDVRGQAHAKRAERQAQRAQRMATRAQRMATRPARAGGRMFAMADTDKDARVTLQEATAAALQRFDRLDLNRDGQVTREERMQFRQQRRQQRQTQG